jgi:8-oxo-dGTP pyrophosphatase MutT (NUDIX family)
MRRINRNIFIILNLILSEHEIITKTMDKTKFAPRDVFEQILEWAVIPTFDLVIEYENKGIILVKRKIAPYQNQWALPGLRMLKGENIEDTLIRIANQELGLKIDPSEKQFLGQYVGMFATEHNRQDLSTGYYIRIPPMQEIRINNNHFSAMKLINSRDEIPPRTGAMYKFYLNKFFDSKEG